MTNLCAYGIITVTEPTKRLVISTKYYGKSLNGAIVNIAITGITGNMGQATLDALESAKNTDKIKLLCHSKKRMKKLLKKHKSLLHKIELTEGGVDDPEAVSKLVSDVGLVINMAAVIPPRSDQDPRAAIACNEIGADVVVSAIENIKENQPALIHISTLALYGNRSGAHPFARVGDPLLVSPFDIYSATKMRGEFRVMESDIQKWAVLRQTAMLHPQMLTDNVHDGLMFHTVYDAPLEWATAHDSGVLIKNIIESYANGTTPDKFWRRCFNISGGKQNRNYGINTFDDGFKVVGGSAKAFFKPWYNATRNFHGAWFLDGDELNDMFDFQSQSTDDYWREVFDAHPSFKLGKRVPKRVIGYFVVKRLLKDPNAPAYWAKNGDEARLIAYFGSRENYEKLKKADWTDIALPDRDGIKDLDDNAKPVYYGFDFTKSDADIDIGDLRSVAEAHGGKLVSADFERGDIYKKLEWQTQDGDTFTATPYTVLRGGHWYNETYRSNVWDFDRLSKKDKVFASVWYDSHGEDENYVYSLDGKFNAHARKFDESEI